MLDIIVIICCTAFLLMLILDHTIDKSAYIYYPLLALMIEFNFKHYFNKLDYQYMYSMLQTIVLVVAAYLAVYYWRKGKNNNETT